MKIHHSPSHWVMIALVLAALLLTLSEAHGQSPGAAAVFEGRPAIAGAQGGLGAQAGVPQGGIGVQGSEAAESSVQLRKGKEVLPERDQSLAKEQRSSKKVVRGIKRSISRAKHGTSPVDAAK
jgi:hypothetical protein